MLIATYAPVILIIVIATLLATVFFAGHRFLGGNAKFGEGRMQPFESGSESSGARHTKLSVKFYLTAILFVVFDIEVAFIYPWAVRFQQLGWMGMGTMCGFLAVLIVGLVYVWKKGALEWES